MSENKIRLNDVIATGTHVDGLISQPLIENIFEPNTPLHDGAVVIRGDRVIAAACLRACPIPRAWAATWARATARASA